MVVTRSRSAEGKKEAMVRRKISVKKGYKKRIKEDKRVLNSASFQVQHHDHDSPRSALQLTHSGAEHLPSGILKHHDRIMVIRPVESGIIRVDRGAMDSRNFDMSKVEEEPEGSTNSTSECMKDAGRNFSSILRPHQGEANVDVATTDGVDSEVPERSTNSATECMKDAVRNSKGKANVNGATADGADKTTFYKEYNKASNNINNREEDRGSCDFQLRNNNQPTTTFNLTQLDALMNFDDGDEVDSLKGDKRLNSIRGYKVKPEYMDLLNSIFSKHGDIAANCSNIPVAICSFYVEYICEVLQKLKTTTFVTISRSELEDMLASLNHIEGENVQVDWLKKRVSLINEAKLALTVLRQSSNVNQLLVQQKSNIKSMKEQLEVCEKAHAEMEEKICVLNCELSERGKEVTNTETMISEAKAKLRQVIQLESLVHDLP